MRNIEYPELKRVQRKIKFWLFVWILIVALYLIISSPHISDELKEQCHDKCTDQNWTYAVHNVEYGIKYCYCGSNNNSVAKLKIGD